MKECTGCRESLLATIANFYKDSRGKLKAKCIPCFKKVTSKYSNSLRGNYQILKDSAKKRGIPVLMDFDTFVEVRNSEGGHCHFCHGPLPSRGIGLDRIVNAGPYVKGNAVPCCGKCNSERNRKSHRAYHEQRVTKYGETFACELE